MFIANDKECPKAATATTTTTTTTTTTSYFSERNIASFPERYPKSEKGWGFDILWMRSPGVRGICANAPLCTALICSVARAWGFSSR